MNRIAICVLGLLLLLSACGKKDDAPAPAMSASASASAADQGGSQPDFGGVTKVSREVEAVGSTQELAILSALQSAVAQVNGVRVASQMQSVRAGLEVSVDGQDAGSARTEAFKQQLLAASQGAVTGYEILSQEEIDKLDEETIAKVRASDGGYSYSASASSEGEAHLESSERLRGRAGETNVDTSHSVKESAAYSEKAKVEAKRGASSYSSDVTQRKMRSYWKVRVRVDVAQYRAPDDQGRPKIVVALPRTLTARYSVGDASVAADEVARSVRSRLSDILTETRRFMVLDREFGSEMQAEIDHINSGNVRQQDSARLGQQLATDLILIPTIESFEYPRHVQKLRMTDRELVSYSGGGRITLRLLNAATGEVVMSRTFEHKLADADPSTMPRVIDGASMSAQMLDALSSQIGGAIVSQIFPVSVVQLDGAQVVLSQGGESMKEGQRWQAVALGEQLKDPQTGRSLGRTETPVGVIHVDRVSDKTSYGTFEGGAPDLKGKPFQPGSIELRKQVAVEAERRAPPVLESSAKPPTYTRRNVEPVGSTNQTETKPAPKQDNKNW